MSRFFPHSLYAEDQSLSHTILTSHVLHRGLQVGSGLGCAIGAIRVVLSSRRESTQSVAVRTSKTAMLVRLAGIGGVTGMGVVAVMLAVRMKGREEIEWQDRSWRLQENRGQLEVDDWSIGGMLLGGGGGTLLWRMNGMPFGWRVFAGLIGIGSVASIPGYIFSRYVVRKEQ